MSLTSIMNIANSGMHAAQTQLRVVSDNVANVNTPGYSRQQVELQARSPSYIGAGYVGNGTQVADIRRVADDLANARLIDSGGELARLQQLAQVTWVRHFDDRLGLSAAELLREALGLAQARRRKPVPRVDPRLVLAQAVICTSIAAYVVTRPTV